MAITFGHQLAHAAAEHAALIHEVVERRVDLVDDQERPPSFDHARRRAEQLVAGARAARVVQVADDDPRSRRHRPGDPVGVEREARARVYRGENSAFAPTPSAIRISGS